MSDLIDRQQAKDAIDKYLVGRNLATDGTFMARLINEIVIDRLPSAKSETFKWCTDCNEYDQEAHCCHRWSKMIRKTVEEMQIVRCKDCIYADYKNVVKALWCSEGGRGKTVAPDDFCSYAERREDG